MLIDLSLSYNDIQPMAEKLKKSSSELFMQGHFGTHVDVPLHSKIPLDYMKCRALLFDVSHIKDRDVEINDIEISKIERSDFVIFKTGMMKQYGYGHQMYLHNQTTLSFNLIDALVERGIRFLGIDAIGVRNGKEHLQVDKFCEQNGVYIIENMVSLDELSSNTDESFETITMWHEIPGNTGIPCRIIASI